MQYINRQYPLSTEEQALEDAQRIQREEALKLRNNRLGLTIFQISWIMVFVCLLVVYGWMGSVPGWRPSSEQTPTAILPTIATFALVLSGVFARQAWNIVKTSPEKNKAAFSQPWRIAIALGVFFFLVMMSQFFAVPAHNDGAQFGYIYRTMIGYHAIHAVVIALMMWQILRYGQDGRYHMGNTWAVEGTTKLWYFVIVAWLMFYAVLYLPYLA